MTHACCACCRMRSPRAAAAYLTTCPACGDPLQPLSGLAGAVGYRLFRLEDALRALPEAIEVSMPLPALVCGDGERRTHIRILRRVARRRRLALDARDVAGTEDGRRERHLHQSATGATERVAEVQARRRRPRLDRASATARDAAYRHAQIKVG